MINQVLTCQIQQAIGIPYIIMFCVLFHRYIFDGADTRTPYLLAAIGSQLYYIGFTQYCAIIEIAPQSYLITLCISYAVTICAILKGRLCGYPCKYLPRKLTNGIYLVYSVAFFIMFISIVINFNKYYVGRMISLVGYEEVLVPLFSLAPKINYGQISDTLTILLCLITGFLILLFDVAERRRYNHIIDGALSLVPCLIIVIFAITDNAFSHFMSFFLLMIYNLIPMKLIVAEMESVLRHSKAIDIRIRNVQRLLEKFYKKETLDVREKFQENRIMEMCRHDEMLQQNAFATRPFNRRYNNYVHKLNVKLESTK